MRRFPRYEPWAAPALAPRRPRSDSGSSSPPSTEVRRFLSEKDEKEVLGVLREQFRHEQRITSDDVRFVVRAVASHGGTVSVPPDFPPTRWILEFKRANGFAQLGGFVYGLPEHLSRSCSIPRVASSSVSSGGSSDGESDRDTVHRVVSVDSHPRHNPMYDSDPQRSRRQQQQQQQQQRRSMVVGDRRNALWPHRDQSADQEELGSNTSSGSFDSENGTTTGASSSSSVSADVAPETSPRDQHGSNYNDDSSQASTSEKRGYKLSHTVPPETWEKAIAAVEQQGMSLRAAAKIYGVHFAALHRRVKKRARGGQSTKGNNGYFHPSDEAGIMRVVVARAELGVLMTFDELMKLVETAALRKLPDISVENARNLMVRFQSRNEQSIRHIIVDWPPPQPRTSTNSGASLYHLEHPGYDYGSQPSSPSSMQRSLTARAPGNSDDSVTATTPSQFVTPGRVDSFLSTEGNNKRPIVLPSMTDLKRSPRQPTDSATSAPPHGASRSRPVMFV